MTPEDFIDYQKSLGANNEEMGQQLGVTGAAVGLWRKGTNQIPKTVEKLLWALRVNELLSYPAPPLIPYGYCRCGCNQLTRIADRTRPNRGEVAGEPLAFVNFHNLRKPARKDK